MSDSNSSVSTSSSPDSPGPEAYLQNSAVITVDWIGFFVLFGSSGFLVYKLMSFKGPVNQPDVYFFGCESAFPLQMG